MANEILEISWVYLTVDFITKLLLIVKKNVILVIYDKLLKIAYFVATTEGTLAEELAILFRNNVWKLDGLLENVISDREP